MNNEKISGFKRNHASGDEKLVVNKCWPYRLYLSLVHQYHFQLTYQIEILGYSDGIYASS